MARGHIISPFGLILVRQQTGFCDICDVPFYSDRDVRTHMATIAHREAVQAAVEAEQARKKRLALVYDSTDPEVEEHLLKVGKRMLAEGPLGRSSRTSARASTRPRSHGHPDLLRVAAVLAACHSSPRVPTTTAR
jgi:hypothetical protein